MIRKYFFSIAVLLFFVVSANAGEVLWSKEGARLRQVKHNLDSNYNWVFLPGGPGMGSEYFEPLVQQLNLPGTIWLLDMPGDGSNRLGGKVIDYNKWSDYLPDAITKLSNVILVAHSFGGMLTLASPELKGKLAGLVLIDTAPNNQWMQTSAKYSTEAMAQAQKKYLASPSDENFKQVTLTMAPLFFLKKDQQQGKKLLQNLPYNHKPFDWAIKDFDAGYDAQWIPQNMPLLIIMGDKDILTPVSLFKQDARFNKKNIQIKILTDAAHFSLVGQEKRINQLLLNYLKSLPGQ